MFEPADLFVNSGGHVFKCTLQSTQMKISDLPLKRCIAGEAFVAQEAARWWEGAKRSTFEYC